MVLIVAMKKHRRCSISCFSAFSRSYGECKLLRKKSTALISSIKQSLARWKDPYLCKRCAFLSNTQTNRQVKNEISRPLQRPALSSLLLPSSLRGLLSLNIHISLWVLLWESFIRSFESPFFFRLLLMHRTSNLLPTSPVPLTSSSRTCLCL